MISIALKIAPQTPPYYYRSDLDGTNKKRIQLPYSFYVPNELSQLSFVNGKLLDPCTVQCSSLQYYLDKFYVASGALDTFNIDGSGYNRIIQSTSVTGNIKYDDASQRIYWQEGDGSRYDTKLFIYRYIILIIFEGSTAVQCILSMRTVKACSCSLGYNLVQVL